MTDLLTVRDLHVNFHVPEGVVPAVRGASFRVRQGATMAIVGESGSGKTVVSQAIMGILPKVGRIAKGEILFSDPRTPGKTVDIAKPDLVQRDQTVTLVYQVPGIYLTVRGKALDSGTEGDVVSVMNLQSKRTISGIVIGRNQVAVENLHQPVRHVEQGGVGR